MTPPPLDRVWQHHKRNLTFTAQTLCTLCNNRECRNLLVTHSQCEHTGPSWVHVMQQGRMLWVRVQHDVKMIMIADDLSAASKVPPKCQYSLPFQNGE
jgi:hypothetical protein